jgi:hypothetical protein
MAEGQTIPGRVWNRGVEVSFSCRVSRKETSMSRNTILGSVCALLMLCAAAQAQTDPLSVPPQNAMKLSQIIAKIEQRENFHYVSDIEWDREGNYNITYYTSDNAKVELKIDVVTGQAKPW